jgi:hypothetical protein
MRRRLGRRQPRRAEGERSAIAIDAAGFDWVQLRGVERPEGCDFEHPGEKEEDETDDILRWETRQRHGRFVKVARKRGEEKGEKTHRSLPDLETSPSVRKVERLRAVADAKREKSGEGEKNEEEGAERWRSGEDWEAFL